VSVRLLLALSAFLLQAALAQQSGAATTNEVPDTCPVTRPYQTSLLVPPYPYSAKPFPGSFWFGTDRLWTSLPTDGAWRGLRGYTPNDATLRQKLFYWRQGYGRYERPAIVITGRRLDSPAPPLQVDRPYRGWGGWVAPNRDQSFMVAGINFPTLGCWEITGRYKDDELTFVVWVAK
jgi:hypothetical protein